jgi:hypothetical protein
MAILDSIGKWFKKIFGVAKPKKPPASPNDYRKATSAEKAKLGKSNVKTPVYIRSDLKRITVKTKTLSKRDYQRLQRGGISAEQYAKSRKPIVREYKDATSYTYQMPVDETSFAKRLIEIMRKHPKDAQASVLVQYAGQDHPYTGRVRYLHTQSASEIRLIMKDREDGEYGEDFEIYSELESDSLKKYQQNNAAIAEVWLKVWE